MSSARPKSSDGRRVMSARPSSRDGVANTLLSSNDLRITPSSTSLLQSNTPSKHYTVGTIVKKLTSTGGDGLMEPKIQTPLELSLGIPPKPPTQILSARDVSYLSDRQYHGYLNPHRVRPTSERIPNIPPSKIPKEFHITDICTDPQNTPESVWDEDSKMWKKIVFPSLMPVGRSEVLMLEDCYEKMLAEWEVSIQGKYSDDKQLSIDDFEAAKKIYLACFVEIVRQVSVHCVERGRLLTKLWNAYVGINDKQLRYFLVIMENLRDQLSDVHAEYKRVCREYEKATQEYEDEKKRLEGEIEEKTKENKDLQESLQTTKKAADENSNFKESFNRTNDALKRFQELLERMHEYTDLIRDSQVDGFPTQSPTMHSPHPPSDPNSKGPYARFPVYLRDLDYLRGFSKNIKKRMESVTSVRSQQQVHLEGLNRSLMEEVDRLRRHRVEPLFADTVEASTQTEGDLGEEDAQDGTEEQDAKETTTRINKKKTNTKDLLSDWSKVVSSKLVLRIFKGSGNQIATKTLLKLISSIYQEKMNADDIDDKMHHPRQPMPEFIYDYFINKYGLRQLAEGHLVNMLTTLTQYKGDNSRIQVFANFCDAIPNERRYPKFAPDFYLHIYRQLLYSPVGTTFAETDDGIIWTPLSRALAIFQVISSHLEPEEGLAHLKILNSLAVDVTDELATLVAVKTRKPGEREETITLRPGPKKIPNEKVIDLDKLIFLILEEWKNETKRTVSYLESMFHAADVSGDGLLQPDEFHNLIQYVDPFCTERQVARMFSGTIKTCEKGIDLETFLQVAKEHNFGFEMPGNSEFMSDRVFAVLTTNWMTSEAVVENGIKYCLDNGRKEDADRITGRRDKFLQLLKERSIPQATWISYKMLMVDASNVRRYNASERNQILLAAPAEEDGQRPSPPPKPASQTLRAGLARRKSVAAFSSLSPSQSPTPSPSRNESRGRTKSIFQ